MNPVKSHWLKYDNTVILSQCMCQSKFSTFVLCPEFNEEETTVTEIMFYDDLIPHYSHYSMLRRNG